MSKIYYTELPNTEIETFIEYSKKVATFFKHLTRGAHTEPNPKDFLPRRVYPYLYWYVDNPYEGYIFYGHNKSYDWILFSLDNIEIGEL